MSTDMANLQLFPLNKRFSIKLQSQKAFILLLMVYAGIIHHFVIHTYQDGEKDSTDVIQGYLFWGNEEGSDYEEEGKEP